MDLLGIISSLNNSKFFSGALMILMNLGSKYVGLELSEFQDEFLSKKVIRRIIIFTIFFISTRDIVISIVLTGIFIIFIGGILNDNSKFCLIKKNNPKTKLINKDDVIKAKKIISKYEKQELKRRMVKDNKKKKSN
jgi:uncharacterized membrane protein (DUF485 family)